MKRFFFLSVFLMCCVWINAFTLSGPKTVVVGETAIYTVNHVSSEANKVFFVTCTNGTFSSGGTSTTINGNSFGKFDISVTWKAAGQGTIMVQDKSDATNMKRIDVTVTNDFDLEDGYSGEPLILNVSNMNPKQFEMINIQLEEHYKEIFQKVSWTIDGTVMEGESMSTSTYFRTTGTKTISAEVYFKNTSVTKTISTTVNVSVGTPDLAGTTIIGKTKLGIGSQASYIVNKYSTTSVEYIWSISPERNINILGSSGQSINVEFLSAGFYTIKCQAKDKMTGLLGSPTSLSVTVSEDYGIMRVSDELFKAYLESSNVLRVSPVNAEAIQAVNQVRYTLCNLTSGAAVGSGYVNKDFDTAIDVSALRKGIYVLYIQVDGKAAFSYKFSLN